MALAAIHGEKTVSELAQLFDVHPGQITQWKSRLQEGAAAVFEPGTPAARSVDVNALHVKLDELTLEKDFLSSALDKAGLSSFKR